ncbi:MAG: hypothetical protein AAF752_08885, partial [Bacteroidota bacterium]
MLRQTIVLVSMLGFVDVSSAQWINPPGTGWLDVSAFHLDTRSRFGPSASRQPIDDDGRAVTSSMYLTGAYGIVRGLDVWASLPFHRLQFDDLAGDRVSSGIGDPRVHVRIGPELFGGATVPVALRAGVKLVGSTFPVDAEIIPLGEGQRDWEVILEAGHSFYPSAVYVTAWAGRRWRERNDAIARDPGDEWFGLMQAGGQWEQVAWSITLEGLRGKTPTLLGFAIPTARRSSLEVTPRLGWNARLGTLTAGVRVPLAGRNVPAGVSAALGLYVPIRITRSPI